MKNKIKHSAIGFVIAAMAMFVSTAAVAYTIGVGGTAVSGEGLTTSVAGATVIDFNSGVLPGEYSGGAVKNDSVSGYWALPPNDTSYFYTVGSSGGQPSPGVLTLGSLNQYFGFYGGSPDTYNSVELWLDDVLLVVFSGTELSDLANVSNNGDQSVGVYWNIWAEDASEYFNMVKFVSTSNAFETDNHAYLSAVPLPASAWLLVSGVLGLIGFSSRRKSI